MIKTHLRTRLKYLCKKSTENKESCYSYLGSGKYWRDHLKKHGKNIVTEIIEECTTKEGLTQKGIYWSKKLNVVNSEEYANLIEERGDGGPTMLGKKINAEQKKRQGAAIKRWWKNATKEWKEKKRQINSASHEKYKYITPYGNFTNAYRAAKICNCSNVTIINRCITNTDKKITSKKYWKLGWKNKTWKELGWYSEALHP